MQLIRIAGPTEPMRRLAEIEGLDFERTSARRLDDDRWQVSGYATDDALVACTVQQAGQVPSPQRGKPRRACPGIVEAR